MIPAGWTMLDVELAFSAKIKQVNTRAGAGTNKALSRINGFLLHFSRFACLHFPRGRADRGVDLHAARR